MTVGKPPQYAFVFRVRYSETDQMGTFASSSALDWFEMGRTELLRSLDLPYAEIEARGAFCPVAEAYVKYLGRARYDDLLEITVTGSMEGRARVRFDVTVRNAETETRVVEGYTIHAVTDDAGKPIRPPAWLVEAMSG